MIHILYNPLAGQGWNAEFEAKVRGFYPNTESNIYDITKVDYNEFFGNTVKPDDTVLIIGGDGTINRFVNATEKMEIGNRIEYYPNGTGNDFLNDIGKIEKPMKLNDYLKDLPTVEVNGCTYRFLNGVGYGIDGYCCEVGDKLKAKSDKPVNYAGIAIKGLLFHFKPSDARITVDGKVYEYKKVWLAPTMHGRCYGGGMIAAPDQKRNNKEGILSVLVWHGSGKLPTLAAFPSIFKGEHIKHEKMCRIITGKEITVEFSRPCALQIDGETFLNISKYTAKSTVNANIEVTV